MLSGVKGAATLVESQALPLFLAELQKGRGGTSVLEGVKGATSVQLVLGELLLFFVERHPSSGPLPDVANPVGRSRRRAGRFGRDSGP